MVDRYATVEDVVAYVEGLPVDMGQYVPALRSNAINGERLYSVPLPELYGLLGLTKVAHKHVVKRLVAGLRTNSISRSRRRTQSIVVSRPPKAGSAKGKGKGTGKGKGSDAAAGPDAEKTGTPKSTANKATGSHSRGDSNASAADNGESLAVPSPSLSGVSSAAGSFIFVNPTAAETVLMQSAVNPQNALKKVPEATREWAIIKQGFLLKAQHHSILKPKGFKLRFALLKEDPNAFDAVLEFYAGCTFVASYSLQGAKVLPLKEPSHFQLQGNFRTMRLKSEGNNIGVATGWVLVLQQVANELSEAAMASQSSSFGRVLSSGRRSSLTHSETGVALDEGTVQEETEALRRITQDFLAETSRQEQGPAIAAGRRAMAVSASLDWSTLHDLLKEDSGTGILAEEPLREDGPSARLICDTAGLEVDLTGCKSQLVDELFGLFLPHWREACFDETEGLVWTGEGPPTTWYQADALWLCCEMHALQPSVELVPGMDNLAWLGVLRDRLVASSHAFYLDPEAESPPRELMGLSYLHTALGLQAYAVRTESAADLTLAGELLVKGIALLDEAASGQGPEVDFGCPERFSGARSLKVYGFALRACTAMVGALALDWPADEVRDRAALSATLQGIAEEIAGILPNAFVHPVYDLMPPILDRDFTLRDDDNYDFFHIGDALVACVACIEAALQVADEEGFDLLAKWFRRHVEVAWDPIFRGLCVDMSISGCDFRLKQRSVHDTCLHGLALVLEHADDRMRLWAAEWYLKVEQFVQENFAATPLGEACFRLSVNRRGVASELPPDNDRRFLPLIASSYSALAWRHVGGIRTFRTLIDLHTATIV